MKTIYVNQRFVDPPVLLRYPLITKYSTSDMSVIENTAIVDHSVFILERFCLTDIYEYATVDQLNTFANLSDAQLLFLEDFTMPVQDTALQIKNLVNTHGFKPKSLWFNIAWLHQKVELENALESMGIYGVNFQVYNHWLFQIFAQYMLNKPLFEKLKNNAIEKRYSVFTRRYYEARFSLFLDLINQDLLKDCEYTFTNFSPEVREYPNPWITKDELKNLDITKSYKDKKHLIDRWIDGLPYCIDVNNLIESFPLDIYERYSKSGINVVIETLPKHPGWHDHTTQSLMITEKTFKAIATERPFMLFAPSGSLDILKKEGFKTFDSWIDESYDNTDVIEEKQKLIVGQLKEFNKLSNTEYYRNLDNAARTTNHNLRRFLYLGKLSSENTIYYDIGLLQK
jgi:hypothetical protein